MTNRANHNNIYLLKGAVQGGKTAFLSSMTELFQKEGITVGGFLSPGNTSEGKRSGFELRQIGTGIQVTMAGLQKKEHWFKYRRFWFNPMAFAQGEMWMEESLKKKVRVLVIDEVGPMELEGRGWAGTLDRLVKQNTTLQLWSVREQLVSQVLERWNIGSTQLIDMDIDTPLSAHKKLMASWLINNTAR
jgi:nucleoside-triphosphatase THEP1